MNPRLIARAKSTLRAPLDGSALTAFRVAFGLLVAVSAARFFFYGWIEDFLLKPRFVFTYFGFSFVTRPSSPVLTAMFAALFFLGLFVALGLFYRVAIVLLFLVFTTIELIDVTNYLNHYYLVSLLALLLSFMPLGQMNALDVLIARKFRKTKGQPRTTFPAWMTYLLRAQVAIVYFYAGLAKATTDWLVHAQPLNLWLSARTATPLIGPFLDQRWAAYVFSWAGFLFDSTIALFLLFGRTRPFAYVAVVVFHVMTSVLFPIGMFPYIMMVAALVFFSPSWPRYWIAKLTSAKSHATVASSPNARPLIVAECIGATLAIAYLAFQILFPLRHRLYGGNVLWHEQGMRFSWKVMVREKNASVTYLVRDPRTQREWEVQPRRYLDRRQEKEFGGQPDLVLQLAHVIAKDERERLGSDVEVRADVLVSLNGRSMHPLVDRTVDLAKVEDGFQRFSFVLPEPTEPPPHLRPFH